MFFIFEFFVVSAEEKVTKISSLQFLPTPGGGALTMWTRDGYLSYMDLTYLYYKNSSSLQ